MWSESLTNARSESNNSWSLFCEKCMFIEGSNTATLLFFTIVVGFLKEAAEGFGSIALGIPGGHHVADACVCRNLFVFSHVPCIQLKCTSVVSDHSFSPLILSSRNIWLPKGIRHATNSGNASWPSSEGTLTEV